MLKMGRIAILVWMLVLVACQPAEPEPVLIPTRVTQADIADVVGLPPDEVIQQTQTARAPTVTASATPITPTATVPTATASDTPTQTSTPTITVNPIEGTETRVFELTVIAQTATAPTHTPTITPTLTSTFTQTPTPSNTLPFIPEMPDNPEPNVVIFTSNRGGSDDIWLMTIRGEPSRPLVNPPTTDEVMVACDPRGEILVYQAQRNGQQVLFASDYDGGSLRRLLDGDENMIQPAWSPSGELLAFVSDRTGDNNIWLVNREGENLRQITLQTGDDIHPSWSPDGSVLFYTSNRNGNFDIYQYSLLTDEETPITQTDTIDELYPVLSPDFQTIAYVAEENGISQLFTLDSNGFVQPVGNLTGDVIQPEWVDDRQILAAAMLEPDNQQIVLIDRLGVVETRPLTSIGNGNQSPRYCYVEEGFLAILPEIEATPILRPTVPTSTPVTPSPTPTITPTATATPLEFTPAETAPDAWLISTETWTGDEVVFVLQGLLPSGTSGFVADESLNFTWQDAEGQHVATYVLEAFRGELIATLIGYTVNDLPSFPTIIQSVEFDMPALILENSIRSNVYTLEELTFTDVNFTLNFRVPAVAPRPLPSSYRVRQGDLPSDWLISTERWSGAELGILASLSGIDDNVSAVFVGDQVQYQWTDNAGDAHTLLVRFVIENGDLVVNPISYTINEVIETVSDDILNRIRESVLSNSIPIGDFFLSRIDPDVGAFTLVFVVPAQVKE